MFSIDQVLSVLICARFSTKRSVKLGPAGISSYTACLIYFVSMGRLQWGSCDLLGYDLNSTRLWKKPSESRKESNLKPFVMVKSLEKIKD